MSTLDNTTVQGVFIRVLDKGVLLLGESGIGKSDLALSMLDRGHALIADDMVEFSSTDENQLVGRSPKLLRNYLNIRDIGVLDIPALFGSSAVLEEQVLSMVVKLEKSSSSLSHGITPNPSSWSLLGITIPSFYLSLSTVRPSPVLLETLVRNYQWMQTGNNTPMKFIENHRKMMSESP